jgi:hypothetical protein
VETCQDWMTVQRCIEEVAVRTRHSALDESLRMLTVRPGTKAGRPRSICDE